MLRLWLVIVVASFCPVANAGETPPITALTFSPDGNSLLAGSKRGLQIFRWPKTAVARSLPTELESIHDFQFSLNGTQLAIGGGTPGETGEIEIRKWPSLEKIATLTGHKDTVMSLAWMSETELVSASLDREIRLWDVKLRKTTGILKGHSRGVTAVAALPSKTLIVSGSRDQAIRVWNSHTGEQVRNLRQHTGAISAIAVRPAEDGLPIIASASQDRTVRFWQPTIGRMMRFVRLDSPPLSIAWDARGRFLFAGCQNGIIYQIDFETAEIQAQVRTGETWLYSLANPTGDGSLAVGGGHGKPQRIKIPTPSP